MRDMHCSLDSEKERQCKMGKGLDICRLQMYVVRRVAKEGKLKAVVSITMDEEFVVHDIKVIEGEKGALLSQCRAKKAFGWRI